MSKFKYILIFLICLVAIYFIYQKITAGTIENEYSGLIINARKDNKGCGYFQLNNSDKWFEMHHLDTDLQIGDSLSKKENEYTIFHYRKGRLIGKYNAVFGNNM